MAGEQEDLLRRLQEIDRERRAVAEGYEEQKRRAIQAFEEEKRQIIASFDEERAQLQRSMSAKDSEIAAKTAELEAVVPTDVEVEVDPPADDGIPSDLLELIMAEADLQLPDISVFDDVLLDECDVSLDGEI